jgi:rhodanese-related sulfurtransferase
MGSRRLLRAALLIAGLTLPALSAAVQAQVQVIDAPSALALPASGGVIVDIRTPKEIAATGRPAGAVPVPLQGDDLTFRNSFVGEVERAAGGDRQRPLALIDANGRRAEFAAKLLASEGFTTLLVVGEGMLGSNLGPGWIKRGLPVEK